MKPPQRRRSGALTLPEGALVGVGAGCRPPAPAGWCRCSHATLRLLLLFPQ